MPEPYNLTNASMTNGLLDVFKMGNSMSDGVFGVLILVMVWLVVFMRLKMYSTPSAITAAGFVMVLTAVLLFITGLIGQNILMVAIVIFGISMIIMWFN